MRPRRRIASVRLIRLLGIGVLFVALRAPAVEAIALKSFVTVTGRSAVLDNTVVRRVVSVTPEGQIRTEELGLSNVTEKWIRSDAIAAKSGHGGMGAEFSFAINGTAYTGDSAWQLLGMATDRKDGDGSGVTVSLRATTVPAAGLRVDVNYLLYPDSPVVRKKLRFTNDSNNDLELESLDVEVLLPAWTAIDTTVLASYARRREVGPYVGYADDSVIAVQSERSGRGLILGNEAPGVMKRVSSFRDGRSISAGLTHSIDAFPFRKWLRPGESWESSWTFVAPYVGTDPAEAVARIVPDFVRQHMGLRLARASSRPTFVYNTWEPFHTKIDARLVEELADAAAACGAKEFVVDDGWQDKSGDWQADPVTFPHGLKPVFEHIKSKGMKPGLWLSLASVARDSVVFQQHPEWLVSDDEGRPMDLHGAGAKTVTACMTTAWKDHMRDRILALVREHGLEYVKLDLAIATSAYVFDPKLAGCRAKNHPHRDREESLLEIYRRTWELFDELHAAAPDLFIDCTFETMGAAHLIDLDMCKHAEGNWLSNFNEDPPVGSLRVRQLGWWRSGAIPAGALVIGNQRLDAPSALLSFASLTGSLPIMLGDPRKTAGGGQAEFRQWSEWFQAAETRHAVMLYRQDLAGFGEPNATSWDGFQRINTETRSGGIVGVFRNQALETARRVYVSGLAPSQTYDVTRAPANTRVDRLTGLTLAESGFEVTLAEPESDAVFEIRQAAR
ncbi:MAG: alpha-galactosidase [Opitutus sp.]